ncbi:hypothetical protein H6G33_02415 [Calothrix sp. FACHB-1219]|uniref:hypothetical protein n=1 Tax=unclassified Calothrix TaxID=2619626 RepID=UPI001683FFDD|nr:MULTISPECIES: hypothetical protein [unclassified Calothrix]MBD2201459.1 hypothetical protein [Calothrix sp. FACHB-168]MBD2215891.1 hypothetical protein [Calothrix sp. FACHB-1219]
MSVARKNNIIAVISLSIALLLGGCNENKASQCQRLVQAVNEGNSLIDKNKGQQVTTSIQLSKDLEVVTKSIEEMNLKDPKLQEYQSRFAKNFKSVSQAIAKAARALNTAKTAEATQSGRQKLEKARAEIDTALTAVSKTAGKDADKLVGELNKYCSEPE